MAIAALNPIVLRPPLVIDTPEHCLASLRAGQLARLNEYAILERELGNQNPPQLDQIRDIFQTILRQLNDLKNDSDSAMRCMHIHTSNQNTPELERCQNEETRLNALDAKIREAAARKGWFSVSRREDLRLDTPDNCLASLQIIQGQRQTILTALESSLLGAQGNLSPQKRSEVDVVLEQAKQLSAQALHCLNFYQARWSPTEQYKECSEEERKLAGLEKMVLQAAAKRGFSAQMASSVSQSAITTAQVNFPILVRDDLEIDTSEQCLSSLKSVQEARSHLLDRLQIVVYQSNPDRFEMEHLLQQAEHFRHLSRFCLERYRWTPEAVTHNTVNHQTRSEEEARLDALEATVLEIATEKGWVGRTVSMTAIDLPSTEKIIQFCKAHPLIPLGLAASAAASAGWIPIENPLGSFAPALAGFLTSVVVDPKQTVLDTLNLGDFVLKNVARRALPIAMWATAAACKSDMDNLSRAPYLLSAAALIQMGAHYELWRSSLSVQSLAASAIDGVRWWFKNGYTTGPIAAAAAGAISYSFDQSYTAIGLFGLGVYGVHAGYAFLHAHREGAT